MTKEKYRYDDAYKTLYIYSEEQNAYLFACKNNFNLSEEELIEEYENDLIFND